MYTIFLHKYLCYNICIVENNTDDQLETLADYPPDNEETLQKGLRTLARIIARSILANIDKHKPEKIMELHEDNENLS